MQTGRGTYGSTLNGPDPLTGEELALLTELLHRYVRWRSLATGRPPARAVEILKAEVAAAAGIAR